MSIHGYFRGGGITKGIESFEVYCPGSALGAGKQAGHTEALATLLPWPRPALWQGWYVLLAERGQFPGIRKLQTTHSPGSCWKWYEWHQNPCVPCQGGSSLTDLVKCSSSQPGKRGSGQELTPHLLPMF